MEEINVLLVDSDRNAFLRTKTLLGQSTSNEQGIALDWIAGYEQARRMLLQNSYDLYLVSEEIGLNKGSELIEKVRQQGCSKPILLLLDQHRGEAVDGHLAAIGADDYLLKAELTAHQLKRRIIYQVEQANKLQQLEQRNRELEELLEGRTQELIEALKEVKRSHDQLKVEIKERITSQTYFRESHQLFSIIGQQFPNGVITVLDRQFTCIYIDGQELHNRGLCKADLIGKPLSEFLSQERYDYLTHQLESVFAGGQVSLEYEASDMVPPAFYQLTAVPLPDTSGGIKHILVVTENITGRKRTEAELQGAIEREKELNSLKSRFVSMASHEFRTPLSTIATSATLIEKYTEGNDQKSITKHVCRIQSSVQHLKGILDEFLSLSRLEEGKVELQVEQIYVEALVKEVISEVEDLAKEAQPITYSHQGARQLFPTDGQLFRNILINLLSNAIKYSEAGKAIEVRTELEAERLQLQVQDQGIGIPQEAQPNLFTAFFRAANVGRITGTGLGLSIVKRYVEMLRGSISFSSKQGQGTVFTVSLPTILPH